ncbi:hypothetical protein F5X68DRAFT_264014 [Plectosphaerella plurivora]|uniref:BZIP domain-containing protein n=1 Tax=Plectosphaerella plurivora TaxID=936078 RepID=A0A9P8V5U2_9PEZI|nr:hypothetical protein F5X68DRAFT_264014 [Plectosphaerella plurivora]
MQRASRPRAAGQQGADMGAAAPDGAETRRARKRQTDRVAQQQHRKRQKQYIEELESQVALLKSASQNQAASRLAIQNLKLQTELKQLYGMWDEMEGLMKRQMEFRRASILNELLDSGCSSEMTPSASEHPLDDGGAPVGEELDESEANFPGVPTTLEEPEAMDSIDVTHAQIPEDAAIDVHLNDAGESSDWAHAVDPALRDGSTFFDVDTTPIQMLAQESGWIPWFQRQQLGRQPTQPRSITRSSRRPTPSSSPRVRRASTPPPDIISPGLFGPIENFDDLFGACIGQYFPAMSPSLFPSMPFPTLLGDESVRPIIERAKQSPHSIGPPTLEDFLFDNPRNTLSTDLKTFLSPVRQARNVSEFLATYWLLYLLFRWQVLETDEAYDALPPWFRPTSMQLSVTHPSSADLIAWPEIREGLIAMSFSDENAHDQLKKISTDIGRFLTVDIKASDGDLWGRSQQQIAAEIINLANWKLGKGFFEKYPQWKGLAACSTSSTSHA